MFDSFPTTSKHKLISITTSQKYFKNMKVVNNNNIYTTSSSSISSSTHSKEANIFEYPKKKIAKL